MRRLLLAGLFLASLPATAQIATQGTCQTYDAYVGDSVTYFEGTGHTIDADADVYLCAVGVTPDNAATITSVDIRTTGDAVDYTLAEQVEDDNGSGDINAAIYMVAIDEASDLTSRKIRVTLSTSASGAHGQYSDWFYTCIGLSGSDTTTLSGDTATNPTNTSGNNWEIAVTNDGASDWAIAWMAGTDYADGGTPATTDTALCDLGDPDGGISIGVLGYEAGSGSVTVNFEDIASGGTDVAGVAVEVNQAAAGGGSVPAIMADQFIID